MSTNQSIKNPNVQHWEQSKLKYLQYQRVTFVKYQRQRYLLKARLMLGLMLIRESKL